MARIRPSIGLPGPLSAAQDGGPIRSTLRTNRFHEVLAMNRRSLLSIALVLPAFAMIGTGAKDCAPLEMGITNNGPNLSSGEPEIAINPTNPGNLFIDYATF